MLAEPGSEVYVLVGDGSYLMMARELVTAVAEGVKLIVVLVQNHGFASIGGLSATGGVPRGGTRYRDPNPQARRPDRGTPPGDPPANPPRPPLPGPPPATRPAPRPP